MSWESLTSTGATSGGCGTGAASDASGWAQRPFAITAASTSAARACTSRTVDCAMWIRTILRRADLRTASSGARAPMRRSRASSSSCSTVASVRGWPFTMPSSRSSNARSDSTTALNASVEGLADSRERSLRKAGAGSRGRLASTSYVARSRARSGRSMKVMTRRERRSMNSPRKGAGSEGSSRCAHAPQSCWGTRSESRLSTKGSTSVESRREKLGRSQTVSSAPGRDR